MATITASALTGHSVGTEHGPQHFTQTPHHSLKKEDEEREEPEVRGLPTVTQLIYRSAEMQTRRGLVGYQLRTLNRYFRGLLNILNACCHPGTRGILVSKTKQVLPSARARPSERPQLPWQRGQ